MINYTNLIAEKIAKITNINIEELKGYIEIPPKPEMGDYSFPCFKLAKTLKKSPIVIANEIKDEIALVEMESIDVTIHLANRDTISPLGIVRDV